MSGSTNRSSLVRAGGRPNRLAVLGLVLISILGSVITLKLARRVNASTVFAQTVKQHFIHFTPYEIVNLHVNNIVTIFRSAMAVTHLARPLFRTSLFGSWLTPVMVIFLEGAKRSNPLWIQFSAILVGAVAQSGGLVWLPVYYLAYLFLGPRPSSRPPTGEDAAADEKAGAYDHANELRAVLPAVVVGYLVPALVLGNPFVALTQTQQDVVNFIWQAFPVTVGLLVILFRSILPSTHKSAHAVEQDALLWTAALCRLIHVSSIVEMFVKHSDVMSGSASEVVSHLLWPSKVAPLSRFIYQFLLADMSLIVLATGIFILAAPGRTRTSKWWVAFVMVAGGLVQGPGASLAWGWRTRRKEAVVSAAVKTR